MRSRIVQATVLVTTLAALTVACGPDDTKSKGTSTSAPTAASTAADGKTDSQQASPKTNVPQTSKPETVTPSEKNGTEYGGYDTEGDVDTSDYNYVCSRLTGNDVSTALGTKFKAFPETEEMHLPKGMAHCTYRISDTVWFTIDYLGNDGWSNHKRQADSKVNGYRNGTDGSIVVNGQLGNGFVMRDSNNMMLLVQEFGVSKIVGNDKFRDFALSLPDKIN